MNEPEVAAVKLPSLAATVQVPAVLIARVLNVATPLTVLAVAVLVPLAKVPLLRVSVTVDVLAVMALPWVSSTATVTVG